jgi:hypothetical protein
VSLLESEAMQTDRLLARRCGASPSGRTWKACVTATRPAKKNLRSMWWWPGKERKGKEFQKKRDNCMYARLVPPSALAFSLASHRHSNISLLFSSRFIDS